MKYDMAKQKTAPAEFLTKDEFEAIEVEDSTRSVEVVDWEKTMSILAGPTTTLRIPQNKEFSRKDVVGAFVNAFELIGGTPRLALWAHNNEGDFYKLYSRLLLCLPNNSILGSFSRFNMSSKRNPCLHISIKS